MGFQNATCHAAMITVTNNASSPLPGPSRDVSLYLQQLSPWLVLDSIWSYLMGYPAGEFHFRSGTTSMSTAAEAVSAIAAYYLIILGGRKVMQRRPAYKLKTAFIVHNLYLTVISGALLALFCQQLLPSLWQNGLYDNVCGSSGWTDRLVLLYYLNYLTKYLELLDTVFLVLRKKPLTFLHTYHHGATALLCLTQLVGQTSVSWVPITLNLTVHVVMYWYYFQAARGIRVGWKKYITLLQITQFVLDLGFIYFACWQYYASTYAPAMPHVGSCGEKKQELAAFTGCAILSSYLVLFVVFYLATYKASPHASNASPGSPKPPRGVKVELKAAAASGLSVKPTAEVSLAKSCRVHLRRLSYMTRDGNDLGRPSTTGSFVEIRATNISGYEI